MKKSCAECAHGTASNVPNLIRCRRYPPVPTALLVPAPPTPSNPNGSIAVQTVTAYPEVPTSEVCGEYAARIALAH